MDDNNYELYLQRYTTEELKKEYEIVEKIFDIDDVTGSLLIEEIDKLHDAIKDTIVMRFMKNELYEHKSGVVCEFRLVE